MRKKCRRKIWATAPGFSPVAHAIAGACVIDDRALADLQTRELSSLEAMTHGRAGLQEWHDLSAALNLCEVAANMGIGPEALPACAAAQAELVNAARRFEASGHMGLTGAGIAAVRDVLEYHHLQRSSISRSQYEAVIRTTGNRIRSRAKEVFEL